MNWLGLDIGGANLKAADGKGWAYSMPFALWRDPNGVVAALNSLIENAPATDQYAVTMTGELCDCFPSKTEGVRHILAAVERVTGQGEVRVYRTDGQLVTITEANASLQLAAASNWRALAQFACRFTENQRSVLIDVGSTTTDIIPLVDGRVTARGRTDTERLVTGELFYSGVGRTPICAVVQSLPLGGRPCPVAAELFATTVDAYLLRGEIDADPSASWTADGRPLTADCARQRLARQLCADDDDLAADDFDRIATAVCRAQLEQLKLSVAKVIDHMPGIPEVFIVSGAGEFLARAAAERLMPGRQISFVSLSESLGSTVSRCAPAHALAVLAQEVTPETG